jgi:hypothetical protein
MSGGIEGVGEAVTGGMISRAVEPASGGRHVDARPDECLNCGTGLIGAHCHQCGQSAHVHRSLHAWWHDFLHSVLHLDGKMWRTLPMLAVYPGDLTRRYIDGERARFVSPLALFLFSVFLMFAVISFAGGTLVGAPSPRAASAAITEEVRTTDEQIRALEAQRDAAAARRADTAALEARLAQARDERQGLIRSRELIGGEDGPQLKTGWARLDDGLKKASENWSLFAYKIQTNAYKFSWALIPISVPFLWLLFFHRRRYREQYGVYDHLIFVTYSIAFMSLGLVALILLNRLGATGNVIGPLALIVPPIHMYRQLRGAYRLRRWSALWRTAVLVLFTGIAMTLFTALLLALGVLA